LIIDYRFDAIFSDGSRDVAMATNFMVKIGKIGLFAFLCSPGIPKRVEYHHSDFKTFICDDMATSRKKFVKIWSSNPVYAVVVCPSVRLKPALYQSG